MWKLLMFFDFHQESVELNEPKECILNLNWSGRQKDDYKLMLMLFCVDEQLFSNKFALTTLVIIC